MKRTKQTRRAPRSRAHDYMMLARLITYIQLYFDCRDRAINHLYYQDVVEHINETIKLYDSLTPKPRWASRRELNKYKTLILRGK